MEKHNLSSISCLRKTERKTSHKCLQDERIGFLQSKIPRRTASKVNKRSGKSSNFLFSHFSSLEVKIKREVPEMDACCKQLNAALSSGDGNCLHCSESAARKGKQWRKVINYRVGKSRGKLLSSKNAVACFFLVVATLTTSNTKGLLRHRQQIINLHE